MRKRNIIIGAGAVALAVAWYAFRPELLFINKTVNEEFPGGAAMASIDKGPMALTQGSFKSLAHETKGSASIYQLADGKRTLRLTDFETSNGPDVHVYLTAAEVEKGNDSIKQAGFIDLGSMKGNKGDQNYDIPGDVDLRKFSNVTIWCARFGVNFGQAALGATASMPMSMPSMPMKVAHGNFRGIAHETKGTASIYQLPEGKKVLRFSGFTTSNGPDVQVYLVAALDAPDNESVTEAGFIRIADLKGNMGDQNYDLPEGIDLSKYRAVTIWCRRFGVNFGTAPLAATQS
ncbi:MAG TPA: DM13 domain-containing protein [Gammaproteobacteria bacterium]|nr:DM13 domain-containing protein [Gammaproteobacteria bacterium]